MDGDEHKRVKFTLLELFKDDSLPKLIGKELIRFKTTIRTKIVGPEGVDVAYEIRLATNRVTLSLLGVEILEDAELQRISDIVTSVMGCIDIANSTFTKSNRKKAEKSVADLKQIAKGLYVNVDKSRDSIISRLQKLGYDNESAFGFVATFIIAGTVTVSASLPRIISLLIETDQLYGLKGNPDRIAKAVDEGLRYTTPGPVLLHGVKKDVELGPYQAKAGSRVMILLYNIMHDPQYSEKPFSFDARRTQSEIINGLWFGTGAHFCMGSVLAKQEIAAAIQALAPFSNNIRIVSRSYLKDGINPGLKSLIVKAQVRD
jgi:cytochrome P450